MLPSSRRAYIKSSLHPAARTILFAGQSSVRRATTVSMQTGIANLSPIGLIVRGAKQKQQAA
jgi:hypothetical protein